MGVLVFLIAVILGAVLLPLGLVYGITDAFFRMKFKTGLKRLNSYFYAVAISIDQLGNTICVELFNDTLIDKHNGHRFGNVDETISSVLGKNKLKGTLTIAGKILDWILDKLDPNHSIKSIEQ